MNYFGFDSEWVTVAQARTRQHITELELVLIAVGLKTEIRRSMWGWRLMTPRSQEQLANHHLRLYKVENRTVQNRQDPLMFRVGWQGILAYLILIWGIFLLDHLTANRIFRDGALYAGAVFDGYWFLTITALTLHSDFQHILGNSIIGVIVSWVACRYFGVGLGWLLILLSGVLGNFLNAFVRPDTFASIGASTAIFGGIGLICGFIVHRRYVRGRSMTFNFAPLVAAIAFFLLFGIGSANTDVVGHFMGMLAGIFLGFLVGNIDPRWLGKTGQIMACILTLGAVLYAWMRVLF